MRIPTLALTLVALLAPGCKDQKPAAPSGPNATAEQAHKEAAAALDSADKAQKKARDKQDDVASAEKEVIERRDELLEAQQKVERERAAAVQASAEATQATQHAATVQNQTQQRIAAADVQAATTREAEATAAVKAGETAPVAGREVGPQTITGKVAQLTGNQLFVEREGQPPLPLQVEPAQIAGVQTGKEVHVTYRLEGGQAIAERVEVTPDVAPAPPGASPPLPLAPAQ